MPSEKLTGGSDGNSFFCHMGMSHPGIVDAYKKILGVTAEIEIIFLIQVNFKALGTNLGEARC